MQQEKHPRQPVPPPPLFQTQTQQLMSIIRQTYQGKTTAEVKQAESEIMLTLASQSNGVKLVEHMFGHLKGPFGPDVEFRRACANLIKKFYYTLAQQPTNKDKYIQLAYDVLVATGHGEVGVKELIAVAVQYIFNKDDNLEYKVKWAGHIRSQLGALVQNPEAWTLQTLEVIHGLVLLLISVFNSLVEPQEQIDFVNSVLKPLCKAANLCSEFTKQNINQSIDIRLLFIAPQKIFQLFELFTQRLLQQQQLIPQQVQAFKKSQILSNTIIQYLFLLCQQKSIISKYPQLNQTKSSIIETLYTMVSHECIIDLALVTLLFTTFVTESVADVDADIEDDHRDRIVSKVISILEKMLAQKMHYQFFMGNSVEIVFALLMYCRTGAQELSDLYEQPEKFVSLAQQFSEAYYSSPLIKVRAANFIKTFINKIDQGLTNITQLCVIFITGSLKPSESDSQILKMAKQAYSDFSFMNLSSKQKLDISFMVLTVISSTMDPRPDTKAIINSVLMTNFNTIYQITDELVLNRLIRLIGYYPNALYFNFIHKLMLQSRANLLEGLHCFDRISRNKVYLEVFPLMHMVFLGIAEHLQVGDPIFERLTTENYENVMKKSMELYMLILKKIYQKVEQSVKNMDNRNNKHGAIICFNHLQKMIKRQQSQKYLPLLQQAFAQLEQLTMGIPELQDNLISIHNTIITKSMLVPARTQAFILTLSQPYSLSHFSSYNEYFQLLNTYTLKTENPTSLQQVYANLLTYVCQTEKPGFNFSIMPQLAHSIGHIVVSRREMGANKEFVEFGVKVAGKREEVRGYLTLAQTWYVFLVLHYVYMFAPAIREYLMSKKMYYSFMLVLFATKMTTKIQRKVAILAAQQLLIYEEDPKLREQIIKFCILKLKQQKERYEVKRNGNTKGKRMHREKINKIAIDEHQQMGQQGQQARQEQERMENEDTQLKKGIQKDQDNQIFKSFKHPFDKICEFSMFKQRIHGLANHDQINQIKLPGITEILQYQWHKNSIRRVFRISKQ